jgi:hypothetical protein
MTTVDPCVERLYSLDELMELRRYVLRYARTFPPGDERNQHLHVAVSLRALFKNEKWLRTHTREGGNAVHRSIRSLTSTTVVPAFASKGIGNTGEI